LWLQTIKHLGELRHRKQVEFAAKRDQGGATVRTSLDANCSAASCSWTVLAGCS